jgi:hypothetical protein
MKKRILGHAMGNFIGKPDSETNKEIIEKPADIGTRPAPNFNQRSQQSKQLFKERIEKILSENNQTNICANCNKLNSICMDIHKDFCELFEEKKRKTKNEKLL